MLKRVSKAVKLFVISCSDDNPDAVIDFYKQYVLTDTQSSELCVRLLIAGKHECARRVPNLNLNKSFAIAYRWKSTEVAIRLIDMGSMAIERETFCRLRLHKQRFDYRQTMYYRLYEFYYTRIRARYKALILLRLPTASAKITKDVAQIIARVVWSNRNF